MQLNLDSTKKKLSSIHFFPNIFLILGPKVVWRKKKDFCSVSFFKFIYHRTFTVVYVFLAVHSVIKISFLYTYSKIIILFIFCFHLYVLTECINNVMYVCIGYLCSSKLIYNSESITQYVFTCLRCYHIISVTVKFHQCSWFPTHFDKNFYLNINSRWWSQYEVLYYFKIHKYITMYVYFTYITL